MSKANFYCEKCLYSTNTKQNYDKHLLSKKHTNNNEELYIFTCNICNKKYKTSAGLWSHKKKCKPRQTKPSSTQIMEAQTKELKELKENQAKMIEEQKILKEIILKLVERDPNIVSITNNNNANFNINIFLNEDCKNAKNLIDFVKEIPLKLENLHQINEKGYVHTITNLLTNHLKRCSLYDRPLHYQICAEEEKNKLHVRDENIWKEDDEEVKQAVDKSLYELDDKVYSFFMRNKPILPEKNNIFNEMRDNSSKCKENEQYQEEVISNITPLVKIP